MAETQNQDEPTLPTKRKLPEEQNPSLKSPKLTQNGAAEPKHDVADDFSDDDNDDDDYKLEEEEEEEEGENPKVVDKKGKGLMIEKEENSSDDDDDDVSDGDDDVSDDSGDVEEGGSSDSEEEDPLAEVDLENILPSRTRRKVSRRGVCIKDAGVNGSGNDG